MLSVIGLNILIVTLFVLSCSKYSSKHPTTTSKTESSESIPKEYPLPPKSVKGLMQAHPGGPLEEVEVAVHQVPMDILSAEVNQATLNDDDLVLGVEMNGQAMAYPIRYLAMYEIVDDRVADTPLAPTW